MSEMTPERWRYIDRYARGLFGDTDEQLATLMDRAVETGLPRIAVSADVGRLLAILAGSTPGGTGLELGTLGGYSGIWIARGLGPKGRLLTVEADDRHADFAEAEFAAAGLSDRVKVIRGAALDVLPGIAERHGPESLSFVFIDAVKSEYVEYFRLIRPMLAPGSLLVADNVYGTGQGWIDEGYGTDEFNRLVATDTGFLATITPMRAGLLVARRL